MEKIEYGKVETTQSISAGKVVSSTTKTKLSYLIKDKYDVQSRLLVAVEQISGGKTDDITIQLIGDGKGGIKRIEVTAVVEKKTKTNVALA